MAAALDQTRSAAAPSAGTGRPAPSGERCVAYMMSRFPKLTETFVLDEILALEARGVRVEVFPLWREKAKVIHPEARAVVDRAHFLPTLDLAILRDNLAELARRPGRYLSTLARVVWANRKSPRYLAGALAIFPKAVRFARLMRAQGVRHVHAHFASHPAAAAWIIHAFSGIPYSFTAHGSDLHREQAMLREKVADAKAAIAISDYNRRFILDHAGADLADRVQVVHCGVDVETFDARDAEDATVDFVCVGTLHAVKGQAHLLDACAKLEGESLDWRCHLVGDGEDRAALEAQALRLGIADRVVFHGALPREGVRAAMRAADVAVAPSVPTKDGRREGIPVVLMEAGATGLPLVGSRLSGIPEIVEDERTGLLVDPGDVAGLAAALLRLAREPETRARLGAAARAHVAQDFSLPANVDRLAALFFDDRAGAGIGEGEGAP